MIARWELWAAWQLATERQQQAVDDYLRRGGQHVPTRTGDHLARLRRKVKPVFTNEYGLHPTLNPDRRCRHCGRSLAGEDIRATVHRGCRNEYRWRRELADHGRARQTPALRLV